MSKVRPFVLYSLRHTFLTRLGAETGDPYKVMMAAGHSSIVMSMRYVQLSNDSIQNAYGELGWVQNWVQARETTHPKTKKPLTPVLQQHEWWAVQDSNLRPPACKAGALTN